MLPFTAPTFNGTAFHCPHCNAYSNQRWYKSSMYDMAQNQPNPNPHQHAFRGLVTGFHIAMCSHCNKPSYWLNDKMVYPNVISAPLPNKDLPEDIKNDFEEARQISNLSPKGAAALLRLAIQKLCVHLGEPGKDLNKDIGSLVQKGLPQKIQKALDVVRVVGNESVHPGQIDLNDNPAITTKLFELVNIIANKMITEPNDIDSLFDGLPENKKDAIEKRDGQ